MYKLSTDGKPEVIGGVDEDGSWHNPLLAAYRFRSGESFRIETGGGGGWGEPLARPVDQVLNDFLDGYISIDRAESSYGVKIDPETKTVDHEFTQKLRKQNLQVAE